MHFIQRALKTLSELFGQNPVEDEALVHITMKSNVFFISPKTLGCIEHGKITIA